MQLVRVDGRYRVGRKILSDSIHDVYLAHDILTADKVVVKVEPQEGIGPTLDHEFEVYRKLNRGVGIPRSLWLGTEAGCNVMVIERLGPSLDELFGRCHFRFSLKTVLFLACQLLRRLQYIHSHNFIHRDLKPTNIVMGVGKNVNLVYIIDFGLSKQFRDSDTRAHIPYSQGHGFTGTAHFASISSHLGLELGRRDDLESLAYILIYFLHGSLPWKRQGRGILPMKQKLTSHKLYSQLPLEFRIFLELSRSLSFDSKPDYDRYYNLFDGLLAKEGFHGDPMFDWDVDHLPQQ